MAEQQLTEKLNNGQFHCEFHLSNLWPFVNVMDIQTFCDGHTSVNIQH